METTEQTWLTEEELPTWLTLVGVLIKLPAALNDQLQRDAGMNHFEYWALMALALHEGHSVRMSELAVLTNGSLSRLSQVISRLEKRGWVRRAPDPTDGRCTLAILTGDGWEQFVGSFEAHSGEIRRLVFDPLTKAQVRQLREIGHRILRAVNPDGPDRPSGFKPEIGGFCPDTVC
ncbi:DNA-binding MarR family transcriptional regulator [Pseudonocardia hierapolitana]|uniref:DNA-binding MarR family transcriptional regulator n=1 Tax=Pseudonocardia hierapolitana TaxID=1128676 RepID=A0A561SP34_9PSEU|nr:MarR family transcriptional regulator [Pseudonocardia hierapolitana]TWF76614.1 DNA-binding MarR family transcriptional regulator [Pseudonocardia hierapolitana]